jgi:hypothetical protein
MKEFTGKTVGFGVQRPRGWIPHAYFFSSLLVRGGKGTSKVFFLFKKKKEEGDRKIITIVRKTLDPKPTVQPTPNLRRWGLWRR